MLWQCSSMQQQRAMAMQQHATTVRSRKKNDETNLDQVRDSTARGKHQQQQQYPVSRPPRHSQTPYIDSHKPHIVRSTERHPSQREVFMTLSKYRSLKHESLTSQGKIRPVERKARTSAVGEARVSASL